MHRMGRDQAMTQYSFSVGSKSAERAVADAIGQEIAARRPQTEPLPLRWLELTAQLDDKDKDGAPADERATKPR
jgi:hypothetical protein